MLTFDTTAMLASQTIAGGIDALLTGGFATPDDGGGALFYRKDVSEPTLATDVLTNSGTVRWGLSPFQTLRPEMAGAVGDGAFDPMDGSYDGTDCTAAIMDVLDVLQLTGRGGEVFFQPGQVYVCKSATSRVGSSLQRSLEIYGDNIRLFGSGLIAFRGSFGGNWRCLLVGGAGKIANGTGNIEAQRCVDKAGYAITGPIAAGANAVPVTAGDEANFTVGDIVYLRTGQMLSSGLNEPSAELGEVADAASGLVYLASPTSKAYAQEYFISGTSGRTSTAVTANPARYEIVNVTDRVTKGLRFEGIRLFNRTGGLQLLSQWGTLDSRWNVDLVEYPQLGWGGRDNAGVEHDGRLHHNGEVNTGYGWHPSTGCSRYHGTIHQTSQGFNTVNLHEATADMVLDLKTSNVGNVGETLAALSINDRGYGITIHAWIDAGASPIGAVRSLATELEDVVIYLEDVRGNVTDDTGKIDFPVRNLVGVLSKRGAQLPARAIGSSAIVEGMTGIITFDKGCDFGRLPTYAIPFALIVDTLVAFNASTNNRINVGYAALAGAYGNGVVVNATGSQMLMPGGATTGPSFGRRQSADRDVIGDFLGTDATQGVANVTVLYFVSAREN